MGVGAIYHTLNPRLFPEQIVWIMNHAEDKAVFVDLTFIPLLEKIAGAVKSLKKVIVLTDKAHMPQTTLPNAVAYEDWLDEVDGDFAWKTFDEGTAAGMNRLTLLLLFALLPGYAWARPTFWPRARCAQSTAAMHHTRP